MNHNYVLWANGPDHSGIVAAVTKVLYKNNCNLEDSSMMRLGAEFGIFLIFSRPQALPKNFQTHLDSEGKKLNLTIRFKPISPKLAHGAAFTGEFHRLTLHGADQPGLVYRVTELLARHRFNITDLQTHRTKKGSKTGYILFIEGHFAAKQQAKKLSKELQQLKKKLNVSIDLQPLISSAL